MRLTAALGRGRRVGFGLIAWAATAVIWSETARGQSSSGNWSANGAGGLVLTGGYTMNADSTTGTVSGTWSLRAPSGTEIARGTWSAAKADRGWNGAWRAIAAGVPTEYSGTFTAAVTLRPDARLAEIFALAVPQVVNGTWAARGNSGAWAIRAAPP